MEENKIGDGEFLHSWAQSCKRTYLKVRIIKNERNGEMLDIGARTIFPLIEMRSLTSTTASTPLYEILPEPSSNEPTTDSPIHINGKGQTEA